MAPIGTEVAPVNSEITENPERTADEIAIPFAPRESPARRTVWASLFSYANLGLKIAGNFLIIPLALKYLGRQDYGLWILLQSMAMYLALSEFGMGQSVVNFQNAAFAKNDYAGVNRILATTFGLYCMLSAGLWLAGAGVIWTQPVDHWLLMESTPFAASVMKPYLLLVVTLTLLRTPMVAIPATLLGLRETSLRQVIELALTVIPLGATILALVCGGRLLSLILATHLGMLLAALLAYPIIRFRHPAVYLSWRFWTPSLLRPLLSNSAFFALYNFGLLFQRIAGNLLAGKFAALADVPRFFILLTLFRVVGWSLADAISSLLMPYVILFDVRQQRERVLFFAQLCVKLTFALAVAFCTALWLWGELGIRMWLGPGMFLGYGPLACLAGAFLIDVLFLATNNFMRALNQHRSIAMAMAFYAALSIVLGISFAKLRPSNPLLGMSSGLLLASLLAQGIPMLFISRKWLQLGWRNFARQFVLRPLLLLGVMEMVLLGFGAGQRPSGDYHRLMLVSLVAALAFMAALWRLVFTGTERNWMIGIMNRSKRAALG